MSLGFLEAWETQVTQTYPSLLKAPGVGVPRGLGGSCKPSQDVASEVPENPSHF